jgi:hypothetical protein
MWEGASNSQDAESNGGTGLKLAQPPGAGNLPYPVWQPCHRQRLQWWESLPVRTWQRVQSMMAVSTVQGNHGSDTIGSFNSQHEKSSMRH